MRVIVVYFLFLFLFLPLSGYVKCSGTFGRCRFYSIRNPFGIGSLFSLKAFGTSKVVTEARPMINLPLSLSAGMIQYFLHGKVAPGPPGEYLSVSPCW